jgi:hypothetical protein
VTVDRRCAVSGIALALVLTVSACSAEQASGSAGSARRRKGSDSPRPPLTGTEIEAVTKGGATLASYNGAGAQRAFRLLHDALPAAYSARCCSSAQYPDQLGSPPRGLSA